jgi:hypothetical protein
LDDAADAAEDAADAAAREARDIARAAEDRADDIIDDVSGRNSSSDDGPSSGSRAAQITRLYDTVFDRGPDAAGLTFWTNALRNGYSLDNVADLFIASPEFQNRYGNLNNAEFVNRLYLNVLDRPADAQGQAYWTSLLDNRRVDRSDVVVGFSESIEHQIKIGPISGSDDLF